ncbi:hypothetical protein QFZ52_001878 [Arthrobacter woluwensis]|nr:hypothetical protein [Arthrobacter woluwensis]
MNSALFPGLEPEDPKTAAPPDQRTVNYETIHGEH